MGKSWNDLMVLYLYVTFSIGAIFLLSLFAPASSPEQSFFQILRPNPWVLGFWVLGLGCVIPSADSGGNDSAVCFPSTLISIIVC